MVKPCEFCMAVSCCEYVHLFRSCCGQFLMNVIHLKGQLTIYKKKYTLDSYLSKSPLCSSHWFEIDMASSEKADVLFFSASIRIWQHLNRSLKTADGSLSVKSNHSLHTHTVLMKQINWDFKTDLDFLYCHCTKKHSSEILATKCRCLASGLQQRWNCGAV